MTRFPLAAAAAAALLALGAAPTISSAQDAAAPAADVSPLSFNIGVTTDYRFRGISQTRRKFAVQGGADYALPAGFYVGIWASNIKWIKDVDGDAGAEIDIYGGLKGEIGSGFGYDVGVLRYQYPNNSLPTSANTTELYGAITFGPGSLKYSHAVTDTFANPDSKNSYYLDLSASFEVYEGISLAPHVGHQKIKGPVGDDASYTDYSLSVSKDFYGFLFSLAVVGSDADKTFYTDPKHGKDLQKTAAVFAIKKTF